MHGVGVRSSILLHFPCRSWWALPSLFNLFSRFCPPSLLFLSLSLSTPTPASFTFTCSCPQIYSLLKLLAMPLSPQSPHGFFVQGRHGECSFLLILPTWVSANSFSSYRLYCTPLCHGFVWIRRRVYRVVVIANAFSRCSNLCQSESECQVPVISGKGDGMGDTAVTEMEFRPLEHPVEPPSDEDQPVKCPMCVSPAVKVCTSHPSFHILAVWTCQRRTSQVNEEPAELKRCRKLICTCFSSLCHRCWLQKIMKSDHMNQNHSKCFSIKKTTKLHMFSTINGVLSNSKRSKNQPQWVHRDNIGTCLVCSRGKQLLVI